MLSVDVVPFEVDVPGAVIRGERAGSGDPLVFLHAGICDRRMWHDQFADLVQDFDVVRFDSRGVGDSTRETDDPVFPFAWHEDVIAVLDHLRIAKATLIGSSFGGRVALDTALAAPERVQRLVLVGSRPSGSRPVPDRVMAAAETRIDAAFGSGNLDLANELEVDLWLLGCRTDRRLIDPDVRAFVLEMNGAVIHSGWYGDGAASISPPAASQLERVDVPTLIVVGEHDLNAERTAAREMAANLPDATLVSIPGTAHLPSLELPDVFLAELRQFLKHDHP